MSTELSGTVVLISGGTRGIGLATGLAFGRLGARVVLTCRWGGEDEQVFAAFEAAGAPAPVIVAADANSPAEIQEALEDLRGSHGHIDVFIANAAFGQLIRELEDYNRRGFLKTVGTCGYQLAETTLLIRSVFGRAPRYVVGLSSHGHDSLFRNYDFIAAGKATMEVLARYLAHRLRDEGTRVNVIRAGYVQTDSLTATLGEGFVPFISQFPTPGQFVTPEEVADAAVALCSGLLDGVSGQVIHVDHGAPFSDNLMRLYDEHWSQP